MNLHRLAHVSGCCEHTIINIDGKYQRRHDVLIRIYGKNITAVLRGLKQVCSCPADNDLARTFYAIKLACRAPGSG